MKASPVLIQTISDVVAQLSPPPDEVKDVETKKMREPLAVWDIKKVTVICICLYFAKDQQFKCSTIFREMVVPKFFTLPTILQSR